METNAQVPNYLNPYKPASDTLPAPAAEMPAPERVSAPPDKVSVQKPSPQPMSQKATSIAHAMGSAMQQGLSYANARRERDTYKPVKLQPIEE